MNQKEHFVWFHWGQLSQWKFNEQCGDFPILSLISGAILAYLFTPWLDQLQIGLNCDQLQPVTTAANQLGQVTAVIVGFQQQPQADQTRPDFQTLHS